MDKKKETKLEYTINPKTELGIMESEEDVERAITEQLKAHGYTKAEIKKWFEEVDKEE